MQILTIAGTLSKDARNTTAGRVDQIAITQGVHVSKGRTGIKTTPQKRIRWADLLIDSTDNYAVVLIIIT